MKLPFEAVVAVHGATVLRVCRAMLGVHDADDARIAQAEHETIHAAILSGDDDAAASAMATHMATAAKRLVNAANPA